VPEPCRLTELETVGNDSCSIPEEEEEEEIRYKTVKKYVPTV
jgi:hypothetical protein